MDESSPCFASRDTSHSYGKFASSNMFSMYWAIFMFFGCICVNLCQSAETVLNKFATSPYYANVRLVTSSENLASRIKFSTDFPTSWAHMECTKLCATNATCEAFNFYSNETAYICELLPVNLCSTTTAKAFVNWPGSSVWDKLRTSMKSSCFDTRFPIPTNDSCESMRPGCLGVWPNCNSCVKTCIDCKLRYNFAGMATCTMWPKGDIPWTIPIFGRCFQTCTYLLFRIQDLNSGLMTLDYRMSFPDMNSIYKLNAYSLIKFVFFGTNNQQASIYYKNSYVDADGTLMNMTWSSSDPWSARDIFSLNGGQLKPTPFVEVTDDRYNCGSFWLLDPNNATYCPGGNISQFGSPQVVAGTVQSTGMNYPAFTPGTLTYLTTMELV